MSLLLVAFASGANTAAAVCAPDFSGAFGVCALEDADGRLLGVAVVGDAHVDCLSVGCVALAVLGDADGVMAVAVGGDASGCIAVAVVGQASVGSSSCTTCLVVWVGGVECHPLEP